MTHSVLLGAALGLGGGWVGGRVFGQVWGRSAVFLFFGLLVLLGFWFCFILFVVRCWGAFGVLSSSLGVLCF